MKRIIIESPYAGDIELNLRYAKACVKDSILRGEAPFASHLLYTQFGILDDFIPNQRTLGINMGFAWGEVSDGSAVYEDLGIARGMEEGILQAENAGRPYEYRQLSEIALE